MFILKKFFESTLTYKIYSSIKNLYAYIKDYFTIGKYIYSDTFKDIIHQYLHIVPKVDAIGRIYGIINPYIDINGDFNVNNTIIELDGDNTNDNEFVKHWIYKQLRLISELFHIENLYHYITLEIDHVGPITANNFLIVFDITSRKAFAQSIKSVIKHMLVYIVIGIAVLLVV